jgi:putative DNA primase/helicase
MYKGYLPSNGKIPIEKIKGKLYSLDDISGHLGDYVGVLQDDIIMLDFDSPEVSQVILKIIESEDLKCNILQTNRGIHIYFKNTNVKTNKTKKLLAIGLECDIKLGSKNTVEPLRIGGIERKWLKQVGELEELPKYFYPLKFKLNVDFMNSTTRNQDLFNHILTLQNIGFSRVEIEDTLRKINTYVFSESLKENELKVVLRDEAFSKTSFFKDYKFQHHKFAKWLIAEKHLCKIDNLLYFYEDKEYKDISKIYKFMLDEIENLKKSQRNEVFHYLNDYIIDNKKEGNSKYINLQNGILDIETMELLEHSSDILVPNRVKTNYNPSSDSKIVDDIISNIALEDENLVKLIYEMIGYTLYRRNELGVCFILVGKGSNGKSTLMTMIENMLGESNISAVSLEDTEHRFRSVDVVGKLVNIGDDIGDNYIDHNETFKKMITGEPVLFEMKGIQPFKKRIYTKFIYTCNNVPRFKDTSYGNKRRLCIIPMKADFKNNIRGFDPFIIDKLVNKNSSEYLLIKSIEGLKRVLENRKFTEVESVKKEMQKFEINNNSVLAWVEDGGEFEDLEIGSVFNNYKSWCEESGLFPYSRRKFTIEIKERFNVENKIVRNGRLTSRIFVKI